MSAMILVEERGTLLEVVLNRPEKRNAVSDEMLATLREAAHTFSHNRQLRVMLIRGAGAHFTSGMELSADLVPDFGTSTLDGRAWYREKFHTFLDELEAIEKPIVVAHQGMCLGLGLEMSLSCDFRLAAESARYGLPEIKFGAMPSSGGVSRLTRLAGPHWARWLVMAGEEVDARAALNMGIVHAVYPEASFLEQVHGFCNRLASQPYELLGLAKLSIELAADLDRAQARNVERIANSILFTGDEYKHMLHTFLEQLANKRTPRRD